jgi:hypothetical protein
MPPAKASADPTSAVAVALGERTPSITPRAATALVATSRDRAAWGIRAVVHRVRGAVAGSPLTERWTAADVPATGDVIPGPFDAIPLAHALTDDADAVDALGITTPDDALPLDVRFYRPSEDRGWLRLLAEPIPGREPADWLWRPDPAWSTVDSAWPSGMYRADVLLGARIVRLELVLRGTFSPAPAFGGANAIEPGAMILDQLEPGPVALSEYGPASIAFAADRDFDERTAWLAPTLGRGFVGEAMGRDVSDLGLLTATSEGPSSVWLEQVSAVPEPSRVAVEVRTIPSATGGRTATLVRPARGGLLTDALYRLGAEWPDGRTQRWEIEVAPGMPPVVPVSPLDAVGRWVGARAAGGAAPVIAAPSRDAAAPGEATCDAATVVSTEDPFLGVTLSSGDVLEGVELLAPGSERAAPSPRFTRVPIDGLAVIALPNAGLPAGAIDVHLRIRSGRASRSVAQRICVAG